MEFAAHLANWLKKFIWHINANELSCLDMATPFNAESKRQKRDSSDVPPSKRARCNYGDKCYRRNPIHLEEYHHPHLEDLLSQQDSGTNLKIPDTYMSRVDTSLIVDQLKVLQKIYKKFADETSNTSVICDSVPSSCNPPPVSAKPQSSACDGKNELAKGTSTTSQDAQNTSVNDSMTDLLSNTVPDAKKTGRSLARAICKKYQAHSQSSEKDSSPFSNDMPARIAAAAPYYFFLTKVRSVPVTHKEPLSITFRELLHPSLGKLAASLQINFLIDLPWVMHHYHHHGVHEKPLLILHGEDDEELRSNNLPPNITAVRIKTPHPFGHHHTKMTLIRYEDGGLRVVVSTANLVPSDWHNRTQGLWVSPVCPQLPEGADTKAGDSPSEFKTDLLRYLVAYKVPQLQEWVDIVRRTDFSDVKVCFIGSVPGSHQGHELDHWGHRRLAVLLKKHAEGVASSWPVVAQCSSIGSLGPHPESWMLDELRASMTLGKGTSMLQGFPHFKVIYPSKQNVLGSVDGALGGDCLPYSMHTHGKQTWFTSFLHQWKSSSRHRSGAVPHIKTYTRISPCGESLAWFHLSSANLSKAAWGMNKKSKASGSGLFMMSYEAGVLFLPHLLIKKPVFHLNPSADTSIPPFPMPYDIPLTRYEASDKPWVMEYLNTYLKNRS